MTGLEKIKGKIITEAKKDAGDIISRASKQCEEIMFAASSEAEKIKAELEAKAGKDAENIIARAKSSAQMQKRDIVLKAKEALVDQVFSAAYKEIRSLEAEKYCEFVSKLIATALLEELENEKQNLELYGEDETDVPEKYELVFSYEDRDKYGKAILEGVERIVIGKVSRDVLAKLSVSNEYANIDGGVIIRAGKTEINCSIDAIFSLIRERMEGEIADFLFAREEK